MKLNITPQDVLRSKVLRPGVYLFEISDVKEETNKAGDAQNIVIDFVGLDGAAKNVPIRIWISEKAPGMAIPLVLALGGKVSEEEAVQIDFSGAKGKKVKLHIENEKYNNQLRNSVAGYAPAV